MGLVYSDALKEWCEATLQGYQLDGIPVPRLIDNYCRRVLHGNAGNTYRKTLTRHRKNTNRKINRRLRRSIRRLHKKR